MATLAHTRGPALVDLLDAYRRALSEAGRGSFRGLLAQRLMARRVQRDLKEIQTVPVRRLGESQDELAAVERLVSGLLTPWLRAAAAAAVIVIADVIISLTASVTEPERLLNQSAELDLSNPLSILALVEATLGSSLSAIVFLSWTLLVAATIVLLPMLPSARRYRSVFCDVARAAQQRTYRELGLPPPSEPMADLRIVAVPIAATLFFGIHLFLMTRWPADDGLDGARITLGFLSCLTFVIMAGFLASVWRRRRRSSLEGGPWDG